MNYDELIQVFPSSLEEYPGTLFEVPPYAHLTYIVQPCPTNLIYKGVYHTNNVFFGIRFDENLKPVTKNIIGIKQSHIDLPGARFWKMKKEKYRISIPLIDAHDVVARG